MTDKQEEEGENVESITYGFAVGKHIKLQHCLKSSDCISEPVRLS